MTSFMIKHIHRHVDSQTDRQTDRQTQGLEGEFRSSKLFYTLDHTLITSCTLSFSLPANSYHQSSLPPHYDHVIAYSPPLIGPPPLKVVRKWGQSSETFYWIYNEHTSHAVLNTLKVIMEHGAIHCIIMETYKPDANLFPQL
jgi:hypothetical protein